MAGFDPGQIAQITGMIQGQAIKIIGGVPILKNVLGSTLEKLKLPKHLEIGNISGILSAVHAGGIGALLQAPLGGALGNLTGAISSAQSALGAIGGAGGLGAALGNLSSSAGALGTLANSLSGFAGSEGLPNHLDLIGHMNLAQSFGDALPAALSLATATAPITSSDLLHDAASQVSGIVAGVTGGTLPIAHALATVTGLQANIDGVASAATSAIGGLADRAHDLAAASSSVALLVSSPPAMQQAMMAAIRPDMLATVQDVISDHLDFIAGRALS